MKRLNRIVLFLLTAALVAGGALLLMGADNAKPYLPGITIPDDRPNGCVDCHKNQGEGKDYRLNVSLAATGKHPKIDSIVKVLPDGCLVCHKAGAKPGALNLVLHKAHYAKGADSAFVQSYQGACLNCHKLNPATGEMSVKSGPKNW